MLDIIKEIAVNIPGVFVFHHSKKPLPTPIGIEIENEGNGIVYISSEIDKWSMYGDRLKVINDMKVAINEAKHEQSL